MTPPGNTTTSSLSFTWRVISSWTRPIHRGWDSAGWWGALDTLNHSLPFKLPRPLQRFICDHFDIAVGMPREEIIRQDYDGKAPWWLR